MNTLFTAAELVLDLVLNLVELIANALLAMLSFASLIVASAPLLLLVFILIVVFSL